MVVGSFTTGRVVTSTQSAYANAYSTGSGSVYSPYGSSYFSNHGTASGVATGSSTTYIPGETTYEYPPYVQRYSIMRSEVAYRRNAQNLRKYLVATRGMVFSNQDAQFIERVITSGKARKFSEKLE